MTEPYDHEALWIKSKLFFNHAMDTTEPRTFDERALWASFALELLAKAALARTSPLLIAAPNESGENLLIATGLMAGDARVVSIRAKTLYSRCHRAFKPFNEKEALAITRARNEYLHGGGVGFTHLPEHVWWPRFWAQASVLVNALDRSIADLVGGDRARSVEAFLARNEKNMEHRVEMLIERARQRYEQHEAGTLPARIANEWARAADTSAGLRYSETARCPACGNLGLLEGEYVADAELRQEQMDVDDYDVWMDLTVAADYFGCDHCRLVLDGAELVDRAGLPLDIGATGNVADYLEPDYGND